MSFSLFGILAVVLEVIRPFLYLIALLIVVWIIALVVMAKRTGVKVSPANRKTSVITGLGAFVLALLFVPALTGASHANLHSIIDYVALFGVAVGVGVVVTLFVLPFIQVLRTK